MAGAAVAATSLLPIATELLKDPKQLENLRKTGVDFARTNPVLNWLIPKTDAEKQAKKQAEEQFEYEKAKHKIELENLRKESRQNKTGGAISLPQLNTIFLGVIVSCLLILIIIFILILYQHGRRCMWRQRMMRRQQMPMRYMFV